MYLLQWLKQGLGYWTSPQQPPLSPSTSIGIKGLFSHKKMEQKGQRNLRILHPLFPLKF